MQLGWRGSLRRCSEQALYPQIRRPAHDLRAPARQNDAAEADQETDNGEGTDTIPEHQVGPDHRGRRREVDEAAYPRVTPLNFRFSQ